jgi:hypothetical protein
MKDSTKEEELKAEWSTRMIQVSKKDKEMAIDIEGASILRELI